MASDNHIRALEAIEDEAWLTIRAAEDWSMEYANAPRNFLKLIRAENKLRRDLSRYFRDLPRRAMHVVNWREYMARSITADEDLIVDVNIDWTTEEEQAVFKVLFNDVLFMMAYGAAAADTVYKVGVQLNSVSVEIQRAAQLLSEQLAKQMTEYTKQQITQSLGTSLKLGEDIREATTRIERNVADLSHIRATRIARTESVRSYSLGTITYGQKTGAIGKTWRTSQLRVCPVCAPLHNTTVPLNMPFESTAGPIDAAPGHPNCRCYVRLEYAKVEVPYVPTNNPSFSETVVPEDFFVGVHF